MKTSSSAVERGLTFGSGKDGGGYAAASASTPARQRLFVQSARHSPYQPRQQQQQSQRTTHVQLQSRQRVAGGVRPASAAWASAATTTQHQHSTRPKSSRERNHATGSSNRHMVFGVGGGAPRPQSAWADVGRRPAQRKGTAPGSVSGNPAQSPSADIIGERRTRTSTTRAPARPDPRRRQRKKVTGYETNEHQIDVNKASAVAPSPSPPPAALAGVPRPYQRKDDVNLIRRVADKLASLGPAQAKYRNNLQSLEAMSSSPEKLLSRQQLCEGFTRFGFRKEEIERLYDVFAKTRRARAGGGVKVLDFLDFFEYFTPLDRLTVRGGDDGASDGGGVDDDIVQSTAPWNRPQSLRPAVTEAQNHSIDDIVVADAFSKDTARAFDVHLIQIVRDLLYHKDNIFRTGFRKMDVNRDGIINRHEFKSSLKEMGLTERQSTRLAEMIDVDKNDAIDYNEFLSAFETYNPIEPAPAFKENLVMSDGDTYKAEHAELVTSVREKLCGDNAGNSCAAHMHEEQTTASYCFEMLSGKLRERERTILHALKAKDVDNNGVIPTTSAVDAIVGTVQSLEPYRDDVRAFVDSVSGSTGKVRYRDMLRAFKDADCGLRVANKAYDAPFRPPTILNTMRPSFHCHARRPLSAPVVAHAASAAGSSSSPEPSSSAGGGDTTAACSDAVERQQDAYLASRRRLLVHKAAKPQHHRRRYDCMQRPASSTASSKTVDPHWFDVVYGQELRIGRFASTPDPRRMI